jgi:hypothetical protein
VPERDAMGMNMWFKDDIRNVLLGVEVASALGAHYATEVEATAYREGFRAALAATAVSFGIKPSDIRVLLILDKETSLSAIESQRLT